MCYNPEFIYIRNYVVKSILVCTKRLFSSNVTRFNVITRIERHVGRSDVSNLDMISDMRIYCLMGNNFLILIDLNKQIYSLRN
jgi:hypothetical protein